MTYFLPPAAGNSQPRLDCDQVYGCLGERGKKVVRQLLVQTPSQLQLLQHHVQQGGPSLPSSSSRTAASNEAAAAAEWAAKVSASVPVVQQVSPCCLVQQPTVVLLASGQQLHGCKMFVRYAVAPWVKWNDQEQEVVCLPLGGAASKQKNKQANGSV